MKKKLNPLLRNLILAGIILLLLAGLAYAFRASILTGVAKSLIVNDELHSADIIMVLNGDIDTRPFYASNLYLQGFAPLVVIARCEVGQAESLGLTSNMTDIAIGVMEQLGVPSNRIEVLEVPGGATSTYDEAVALHNYVETHPVRRIILVTSAFHTRRARWIFKRELAGLPIKLETAAVPYRTFDATNWWRSEDGLITLNNEYIKLVFYLLKYH